MRNGLVVVIAADHLLKVWDLAHVLHGSAVCPIGLVPVASRLCRGIRGFGFRLD